MLVPHGQDEQRPGDAERHDPDERDLDDRVLLLLAVAVAQWIRQRHVPIHGDHAQVTDRGRGEENVEAVPADAYQLRQRHICIHHHHHQVYFRQLGPYHSIYIKTHRTQRNCI